MERDEALRLIVDREWETLLNSLKNNKVFDKLYSDSIFIDLFNSHFINEFISDNNSQNDNNIVQLTAIYHFHISSNYRFVLTDIDYKKLVLLLIDKTGEYTYASIFPHEEASIKIITEFENQRQKEIEETKVNANFEIDKAEKKSTESYAISIFKSPQEKEFYLAAKEFFKNSILLPNAALSTVINNQVLDKLKNDNIKYFLSATVDLVVISTIDFLPTHFFELDSSFHDNPEQRKKDLLKNELISNAGFELYRIRKKIQGAGVESYLNFLNSTLIEN